MNALLMTAAAFGVARIVFYLLAWCGVLDRKVKR